MYCEVCCCLHILSVVNVLVMGRVLGQSLMFISTMSILLYSKVCPLYNGSALLLFTCKLHCLQTFEHTSAILAIKAQVFVMFHTNLLGCLRYREKHVKDVCCCLQTCNSVVYVVVMGLVLGQSLMVISTTGSLLYAKVSPLYYVLWECIFVVYT